MHGSSGVALCNSPRDDEIACCFFCLLPSSVGATGLTRVHDQPAGQDRLVSQAKGIHAVIVNGMLIREDNTDAVAPDGDLPGRVLRSALAA